MNGRTATQIAATLLWSAFVSQGCASLGGAPEAPWSGDESVELGEPGFHEQSTNRPQPRVEEVPRPRQQAPMPLVDEGGAAPDDAANSTGPKIIPQGVIVPAKLVLAVDFPDRKQVGSDAVFRLTIQNIGDEPMEEVVVESDFDAALDFPGRSEKKVRQSLGRLVAQETKQIALTLVSDQVGEHCCRFTLFSQGREAAWKSVCVAFLPRQLDIEIVGPSRRTIGSRAEFTFKLANVADVDLKDVRATVLHDSALTPHEATAGVSRQAGTLSWELDTIAAKNGVLLQVEFQCDVAAEHATIQLQISGQEIPDEQSEVWLTVVPIKGILDLRVNDTQDPLALGEVVEYVVSVRNRGLQEARDIHLEARISPNLRVVSAEVLRGDEQLNIGHQVHGQQLRFDPVASLAPEQALRFTVLAKALRPGQASIRASLSHSATSVPVQVTELSTINP